MYINRITYLFGTKNSRVYVLAVKFDESSNSAIWTIDRRFFSAPIKMFKSDISFDFRISDKSVFGTFQANCGFPFPRQHVKKIWSVSLSQFVF